MTALQRNDVAIAQKAINLARGLSGAEKAVASAIIDHFNRKTGQCDPSIERLAALLELDERTVRRATAALSAEHGLFRKRSHGGKSFRASYAPIWSTFRAIVNEWDQRMKGDPTTNGSGGNRAEMSGSASADEAPMSRNVTHVTHVTRDIYDKKDDGNRTEMSAYTGQKCPVEPGENVLQTNLNNPSYKPIASEPTEFVAARDPQKPNLEPLSQGLLRGEIAAAKPPGYEARERAATRGCSHADAAWATAEARLQDATRKLSFDLQANIIEHSTEITWNLAVSAEMRRRGQGLVIILDEMRSAATPGAGGHANAH
ncbi:helix-turn-helix domain-containing protein [Rhizobium sp. KVB221]|uniref:Helix-turn-helix domain-containing protein n=1 Tax=Rhizobium setariae TaxID=2801340 RepID=A0A937CPR2_9HYPH|nr:helix-turn-helix domain-containing protein [Rhizobium setariae]MBL0375216.1 helix-turn-helix domain-containing protein [Rhizobium setariae]